jgi:epoxyqueuosine reductase
VNSAILRSIIKLSKEVLDFAEVGIISLNGNLNTVSDIDSKSREVYDHLKTSVINKHDWAKSVIVLVRPYIPYKTEFPYGFGVYSAHYKQYPLGRKAVKCLSEFIENAGYKAAFDSGIPVKAAAFCSGLGRYGRNSLIYTKEYGSFITLHTIVTDALFDYDDVLSGTISDCGNCNLCTDACPTKAIMHDGKFNKSRCLREHMLPKNIVPLEIRRLMGSCILGCDICQIVCPMNKNRYANAILPPDDEAKAFDIENILYDSKNRDEILDYISNIAGTNYVKQESILSAATITAGNMKEIKFVPHLTKLLKHPNPSIRVHAAWALAETDAQSARDVLVDAIAKETDETVKLEMQNFLSNAKVSSV